MIDDAHGWAFVYVRLAKIQISLRIRAVWSEFSLGAFWIAKDAKFLHADNEDWSDCADAQADLSLHWAHMSDSTFSHVTAQMSSLIFSENIMKSILEFRLLQGCFAF